MKLCRYGKPGYEKPGMIDGEGKLRDLSKIVDNIGPNELSPRGLKMLTRLKPESLPLVNGTPKRGLPLTSGSVSGLSFASIFRPRGDSSFGPMLSTIFDRSRSLPSLSIIPGFS